MSHSLQAGIARRDITPPAGTELFGYPEARFGEEVADRLGATALVLQRENTRAVLISLDVAVIDEAEAALIRAAIAEKTGIEPHNVTVSATHTHSAPITFEAWGWGQRNQQYLEATRPLIVEAVEAAVAALQPVKMGVGTTPTRASVNRREVDLGGGITFGFNEWGPRDETLTVVRFEGEQGTVANLIHVGAHPTSRGHDPAVSRDWPGVMMDRVELVTGAPVLFINGAFGDVAPRTNVGGPIGDGAPAAREVGLCAATDALRAWHGIKEWRTADLQTLTHTLALPHAPLPSREETDAQVKQLAGNENARGNVGCEYHHWNAVSAALDAPLQTQREWQQTLTRIGPVVIVPMAGEIFAEIALRIRHSSPFEFTLCAGTSNGSHGYYVTREGRARGGYEPWVAKAYGAYILADNIDDVLVRENVELLRALARKRGLEQ